MAQRRRRSKPRARPGTAVVKRAPGSSSAAPRYWQCAVHLGGSALALRLDLGDLERIAAWLEEWTAEQRALQAPSRKTGKKQTRRKRHA